MKFIKWLSLLLLLLLILPVYLLGVNTTMSYFISFFFLIKENIIYFYILTLFSIVCLLLYFVISLYILHIYSKKIELGERIYIPKTLPDFIIKELEGIKSLSMEEIAVKELKRMYYIQISIYIITIVILYLLF